MAIFNELFQSTVTVIPCIILLITTFLAIRLILKTTTTNTGPRVKKGLPLPGPTGIPVFGSIFSIRRTAPYKSFMELALRHGNIFQIQLGNRKVLVLNNFDAIQKALVKQPATFAGRPDLFFFKLNNILGVFGPSFVFSNISEQWELHHRLAEKSLRQFTTGNKIPFIEKTVVIEAKALVDYMTTRNKGMWADDPPLSSVDKSTNIRNIIALSVSNILSWHLFGKRRSYDDKQLTQCLHLVKDFTAAMGSGNLVDFFPWLKFLLKKSISRFVDYKQEYGLVLKDMVMAGYETYEPGSERNILEHLITTSRNWHAELERQGLTEHNLLQTVGDLFGAGNETVSTTLKWCILYMAKYPEVQDELQRELDTVVGRDRLPCLNDRDNLPLIQSCLLEIQRHATVTPLAIPHSTTKETTLDGFYVPKDTLVFVNLYSAHHDPTMWEEPEIFNVRRFLTPDGSLDRQKASCVIPFSLGRRRCIGADLAKINLFLYFSIFLQKVTFSPLGGRQISLEPVYGLVQYPKKLLFRVKSR